MEKFDVVSLDGIASKITVFRGPSPEAPVVLVKPAMSVAARHYTPLAQALAARGWNAATADLRGNGESSVRPGPGLDFGYHELVSLDWPAEVNLIKSIFPQSPRLLMGHSLGGQMSALYMSTHPGEIHGLVTIACPLVYYRGWPFPHNLKVLFMTQVFSPAGGRSRLLPRPTGRVWGNRAQDLHEGLGLHRPHRQVLSHQLDNGL